MHLKESKRKEEEGKHILNKAEIHRVKSWVKRDWDGIVSSDKTTPMKQEKKTLQVTQIMIRRNVKDCLLLRLAGEMRAWKPSLSIQRENYEMIGKDCNPSPTERVQLLRRAQLCLGCLAAGWRCETVSREATDCWQRELTRGLAWEASSRSLFTF